VTLGSADNVLAVAVTDSALTDVPASNTNALDYIVNGGLYRHVYVTITNPVHIPDPVFAGDAGGGMFATYPLVSAASATIALKTWVKNDSSASVTAQVKWLIIDVNNTTVGTAQTTQVVGANATGQFTGSIVVANPRLWSPSTPNRYILRAETSLNGSTIVDDYEEYIGIRKIAFSQTTGFSINGLSLKLFGVNRHEMWPFVGHAVSDNLQRFDAALLKDMGCNMLRLSHYPQSPSFLNACDSLGLMVYEEAPGGSNNGKTPPYSALWDVRAKQSMREMIRRDRNRPSIICWGTLNEPAQSATWETGADSVIHNQDTTRPTTQSRNYATANNVYDIYAHNSFTDLPAANPDPTTRGYINSEHTGHTFPTPRDSNELRLLSHAGKHEFMTKAARSRSWVAGGLGWCAFDYNSANNWGASSFNSYLMYHGVCDLMRIPKFAYYFYQSQRDTALPMVHIVNYWQANSPLNVKVYSNCEQIRLSKWNGSAWVTYATQSPDTGLLAHPPFTFALTSHDVDRIKAEGLIGGIVRATDIVRQPAAAKSLSVKATPDTIIANGSDLNRVLISIVDSNGTLCPYATSTINVSISGPGKLIGDNPITAANEVSTHQCGSFGILVQSQYNTPGTIIVTASATGLSSAAVSIVSLPNVSTSVVPQVKPVISTQTPNIRIKAVTNPVHAATIIHCSGPKNETMLLQVFDASGRLVETLYNKTTKSGNLSITWNASRCGNGVYFLKLKVGETIQTQKVIVE
jgi:beta-galactosidase